MSIWNKLGFGQSEEESKAPAPEKEFKVNESGRDRSLLSDLEKVQGQLDEKGEMSPEELEAITGMNPEEYLKYAMGDENINIAEIEDFNQSLKESLASQVETYQDPNIFKKMIRSQAGKAAFVSLLLFLKFAPQAQAAEPTKPETSAKKFNIELNDKSEKKIEGGDKTYHLDAESSENLDLNNLAQLDLSNSYETDKADIPADQAEQIKAQVKLFLSQINEANYHDFMSHDIVMYSSSDQRKTNNWDNPPLKTNKFVLENKIDDERRGGNANLAENRGINGAEAVEEGINEFVKEAKEKYKAVPSGLNPERLDGIAEKPIIIKVADSKSGPEAGITYLTDLKKDNGKNYTEKEIEKIKQSNPDKYQKLLEECRYVKVNLMAEGMTMQKIPNIPVELGPTPDSISVTSHPRIELPPINNNTKGLIAIDISPSMAPTIAGIAQYLLDNYPDSKAEITIEFFSDHANSFKVCKNINEAVQVLRQVPTSGNTQEKVISSTLEGLDRFSSEKNVNENRWMVTFTDESFQDVTYNKLMKMQEEAADKDVYVKMVVPYLENKQAKYLQMDLDGLIKDFTKPTGAFEQTKIQLEKYSTAKGLGHNLHKEYAEKLKNIDDENIIVNKFSIGDEYGHDKLVRVTSYN